MAKGKRGGQAEELDLVPIMNLVTILIPFLLMASSFVSLAAIDSTLPAIGQPPEPLQDDEDPPLSLSIDITDEGYIVKGGDESLKGEGEDKGLRIPCAQSNCPTPDTYDTKELRSLLVDLKEAWPEEENVILVPTSQVPYEVLVLTMDATRNDPETTEDGKPRDLFPFVVIAGGVQ
ncbi:MAG: biopolymer transporter ExbD [Myxococcales bacterium]|nr:biopolymer transporter ExbD [Myxococcales bacterium]